MAIPATVSHIGTLSGSPAQGSIGSPSLQEIINTSFSGTYGSSKSARPSIVGATDGVPFVLPFETITKVRVLVIQVRSGSIKVKCTSAAGALQALLVSSFLLVHAPNPGDEITAIQLVGTADIEYFIAGDTT